MQKVRKEEHVTVILSNMVDLDVHSCQWIKVTGVYW